jgi:exodeoxyribonuclease-1
LAILARFHQAPWANRLSILRQVEDTRLRKLGQRLIFVERPDVLTAAERERYAQGVLKRLRPDKATKAPWRTLRDVERWFDEHDSTHAGIAEAYGRLLGAGGE